MDVTFAGTAKPVHFVGLHVLMMIVVAEGGGISCRETSPLRSRVQKHLEQITVAGEAVLD